MTTDRKSIRPLKHAAENIDIAVSTARRIRSVIWSVAHGERSADDAMVLVATLNMGVIAALEDITGIERLPDQDLLKEIGEL